MPTRCTADLSDDLKQVILKNVQSGMSYRRVAYLTGVSVDTVARIIKVLFSYILKFLRG